MKDFFEEEMIYESEKNKKTGMSFINKFIIVLNLVTFAFSLFNLVNALERRKHEEGEPVSYTIYDDGVPFTISGNAYIAD